MDFFQIPPAHQNGFKLFSVYSADVSELSRRPESLGFTWSLNLEMTEKISPIEQKENLPEAETMTGDQLFGLIYKAVNYETPFSS